MAVELVDSMYGGNGLVDRSDDESRYAFIDDFPYRTVIPRNNRRPASHGFDQHQTEGFGPIDRKQQRFGSTYEQILILIPYLADIVNAISVQERLHNLVKIGSVYVVDLRSKRQRKSCTTGNFDGAIRALFRRKTTDEK